MQVLMWLIGVACLGRTTGCFSPLYVCPAASGTMEVGPQGGRIQVGYSSGALGPAFEVHGVWRNRDVPASSLG